MTTRNNVEHEMAIDAVNTLINWFLDYDKSSRLSERLDYLRSLRFEVDWEMEHADDSDDA